MTYVPPERISDTATVGKVIRALGCNDVDLKPLWGLHPATVGVAVKVLLELIDITSGGQEGRIEDAYRCAGLHEVYKPNRMYLRNK